MRYIKMLFFKKKNIREKIIYWKDFNILTIKDIIILRECFLI